MATTAARPTIDRVQDTARWVAMARALESERRDSVFTDPFARELAGPRGAELARGLGAKAFGTWPIVARTHVIDALVAEAVRDGADAVVNLAAGFDTRPHRLPLPEALTWIEVDHADVIGPKEEALRERTPRCRVERISLDLAAESARRALFAMLRDRFERVLVITEGLLYYLSEAQALGLAADLLGLRPFRWITDLHNAAVLEWLATRTENAFQGTATMQFAPNEGPLVFEPLGWRTIEARSVLQAAGRLRRLPFPMSWLWRLPEKRYGTPGRPWTGVCVLEPAQREQRG